jgi:micrococcal nuclease
MGSASYTYRAVIREWLDGDTVEVDVDLGFGIHKIDRVRLYGINCPEKTGTTKPAGLAAKAFAANLAPPGSEVAIKSYKSGVEKFGRWLATIVLDCGTDLAAEMIRTGHGVEYHGERRT